ncbi:MAG: efflux RND transporter periplasmic adaptor subunit [Lysobacterales bacterium]
MKFWQCMIASMLVLPICASAQIEIASEQAQLLGVAGAPVTTAGKITISQLQAELAIAPEAQRAVALPYAAQAVAVQADLGARVERGQVLAEFVSAEYASARAELEQALVEADQAQRQARRDEQLLAEGIIAAGRAELSQAQANAAQARVRGASAAQPDLRHLGPGRFALLAPISGEISARATELSSMAPAWSVAFVVADPSQLVATLRVPGTRSASVRPGDTVQIGAGRGEVVAVGSVLDASSQTVLVRARIAAADELRAGERQSASLVTSAPPGSLRLPPGALWYDGDQARVFAILAPTRYQEMAVEVIEQDADGVIVRADLAEGTQVVVRGIAALKLLREAP